MLNKKRAFISFGAGIVTYVGGSVVLLFTWKLLNSPQWMSTAIVWILVWPTRLIGCVFTIPYPRVGAVAFALFIGLIADITILSGLFYVSLSLLGRKATSLSPPTPPRFQ